MPRYSIYGLVARATLWWALLATPAAHAQIVEREYPPAPHSPAATLSTQDQAALDKMRANLKPPYLFLPVEDVVEMLRVLAERRKVYALELGREASQATLLAASEEKRDPVGYMFADTVNRVAGPYIRRHLVLVSIDLVNLEAGYLAPRRTMGQLTRFAQWSQGDVARIALWAYEMLTGRDRVRAAVNGALTSKEGDRQDIASVWRTVEAVRADKFSLASDTDPLNDLIVTLATAYPEQLEAIRGTDPTAYLAIMKDQEVRLTDIYAAQGGAFDVGITGQVQLNGIGPTLPTRVPMILTPRF